MGRRVAKRRQWPAYLFGAVIVGSVWGTLLLSGVRSAVNDWTIAPVPNYIRNAVDLLVAVINGVRWISPFLAAAGVAAFVTFALLGRASGRARTLNRLAKIEYAGVDHVEHKRPSRWRLIRAVHGFAKGTGLAVLAILLVGATSGIEHEVTNGPLRPIHALTDLLGNSRNASFVFQSPKITFMDDSSIPKAQMDRLVASSTMPVVPFGKYLFNLNNTSALEISIPDALYATVAGEPEASACDQRSVVVDDTVGTKVGDHITLNGVSLRVAKVDNGIAQMNRSIAILADSTVRNCILSGTSTSYFGALVASSDLSQIDQTLRVAGVSGAAVSQADFLEYNRNFWRANATPLLLQLILYLALFSAFAAAGERQSRLQRNAREIGMLNATGVDFKALQAVEYRRALRTTLKATVLAAPLMVPVAAAFNASELGVHISVGITEVAVGMSLTLVAMLAASKRALSQFSRSLDLPLAVKG